MRIVQGLTVVMVGKQGNKFVVLVVIVTATRDKEVIGWMKNK